MARTPTTRRRGLVRRAGLTLLCGTVVVAVIACGGGDDDEDAGTDPTAEDTTTSPPTTEPASPEEEARAVYLEFVEVVYGLLTTDPDPDAPALQRVAVDPVLGSLKDNLATMRAEHHIVERGDQTRHEILDVTLDSAGSASLEVCSTGNDRTLDRDDGSIVDEGMSARFVDVSLVRGSDGVWRVSELATRQIFDGALECPR